MKKTMSLFKKLIALVLSVSIIYGYSITPVMALENDQNIEIENTETISMETEKEITDKVIEEKSEEVSLMGEQLEETASISPEIKAKATELLEEGNSYLESLTKLDVSNDYEATLNDYNGRLESVSSDDDLNALIDEIASTVNEIKEKYNDAVSAYVADITNEIQTVLEPNLDTIFNTTLTEDDYNKVLSSIKEGSETILDSKTGDVAKDVANLKNALNEGVEIDESILTEFVKLNYSRISIIESYDSLKEKEITLPLEGDTLNIDEVFVNILSNCIYNELDELQYKETTEEEQLQILDKIKLTKLVVDKIIDDLKVNGLEETESVTSTLNSIEENYEMCEKTFELSFNSNLSSLKINDVELDLEDLDQTIYVGNDVTKLNLEYITQEEDATVYISDNAYDLQVGENIITIYVYAPNGISYKIYTLTVVREEAKEEVTTPTQTVANTNTNTETAKVMQLSSTSNNNYSYAEEEVKEDKDISNTSDSKDKYNEEVEEESSLSWWIVLIIVILIAIIAFIVYKLFGDKDDQNFDKNFMNNNKGQSKNKKVNKNKK